MACPRLASKQIKSNIFGVRNRGTIEVVITDTTSAEKGLPIFQEVQVIAFFPKGKYRLCCDVLLVLLKGPFGNKLQAQLKAQFIYDNGLLTIRVCKFGHH
jgi:hypothetical protein